MKSLYLEQHCKLSIPERELAELPHPIDLIPGKPDEREKLLIELLQALRAPLSLTRMNKKGDNSPAVSSSKKPGKVALTRICPLNYLLNRPRRAYSVYMEVEERGFTMKL